MEENGGVDEKVVNDGNLRHDRAADDENLRLDISEHVDVGFNGVDVGHEEIGTAMEHHRGIRSKLH